MDIGDKHMLINRPPYSPLGHTEQEATFITIRITEERESKPCPYSGDTLQGYIAKGSDGYTYAYNYPAPNMGFGSTPWKRWMSDEEFSALPKAEQDALIDDHVWYDLTGWQCPAEAEPAKKEDFVAYCETHQEHFYIRRGCFGCKHNLKPPKIKMDLDDHAWAGWY